MKPPPSLNDAPTREIYLLENVSIFGRKTELRQLLKLLNLAKTGQSKAALITGDAGIGKSALLTAFIRLVREGIYCRVLDMGKMEALSPEHLYVAIIERLQAEADEILNEALVAVNEITRELDLKWERQDLVRAIALVKLQESIGGKDAVSQEQLVKAIRSQVPAIKKLKFSVNESIEKLVDLIVNPWVMVATSLLNPMSPPLQDAIRMVETLKENNYRLPGRVREEAAAEARKGNVANVAPARKVLPALIDDAVADLSTPETSEPILASEAIVHLETPAVQLSDALRMTGPTFSSNGLPLSVTNGQALAASSVMRLESPPKPIKDPLVGHLMTVLNFINSAIEQLDSALLITLDEWDRIARSQQAEELKAFVSELLYQITEQKSCHLMVVMTARSDGESFTLGGPLYNHFRTKLLLEPLSDNICRKMNRQALKESGADLDEDVVPRVFQLSKGNPYWHLKILSYLRERVESSRVKHVDTSFFDKLGVDTLAGLPELSFTRLKLAFLNDEESLYKVIATLIKAFGESAFSANLAIKEISASQGFTDGYVFEVLRALYRHDFIREAPTPIVPKASAPDAGMLLEDRGRRPDPVYVIQSRYILDFLQDKTRAIETDITTDEKLLYLRKIIPLSVKSGELDREKTMEVLALSDAMGRPEIVEFLEEIFLDALRDDKAVVRVTALNNVALLDSVKAREALFKAMRDDDSMVREYAARNLAMLSQKSPDPALATRVVETMLQVIDDESEAVRAQVYGTLSKYKWHRDLLNIFIKGLSDACDSVRLISIQNLVELESDSPFVFSSLRDAMSDPVIEIRRYACQGFQKFHGPEVIDAMVRILQSDEDASIRALAADSLSRMEDPNAFRALIEALRNEAAEDVKLAVVKALGKRRGWQIEEILLESLQNANPEEMPVFVWAGIRSLGQVGGTERSLNLLSAWRTRLTNPIILSAVDVSSRQIRDRIGELRQLERQLEEATPVTVAIPSEYEQEIDVPEEEIIAEARDENDDNPAEPDPSETCSAISLEGLPAYGDGTSEDTPVLSARREWTTASGIDLPFEKR